MTRATRLPHDDDRVLIELIRLAGDGATPEGAAAALLDACGDRDVLLRLRLDVARLRGSYQHRFAEHAMATLSIALARLDRSAC